MSVQLCLNTKFHLLIAITDQIRVLSKSRLLRLWGRLSEEAIAQLNRALLIALDLPGQDDKILLDVD
ncbi:MAG: type II toxin-antitoxin system PemK/MazF family toxin [Nostoc sp.]|uniref:type II toxin-antitoxin system PemK/MazF family toxin n=1 Tax=Nostoc sp. TaxID=1180 RepID=UPI002FF4633C